MRTRQAGAGGVLIAVVLVVLAIALLAARILSRTGEAADDKNNTIASLTRAQTALDQYVAAGGINARLPCPADPGLDSGLESPKNANDCNFQTGTLPWATIGLRRDDAYDAWGRKISYRLYIGNKGSLVQAGVASMVNCYLDPNNPNERGGGTTGTGGCATDYSTSSYDYLNDGKGLKLTDFGLDHTPNSGDPTAYAVISHGPTGLGGYSSSGVVLVTEGNKGPSGDENDNTKANGPFHVEAWSDPDTAATDGSHFDDLVAYRTIADLLTKANVGPRAWPAPSVASTTFTNAPLMNVLFALTRVFTGSTNTVNFGTITASGVAGGAAANITLDTSGPQSALGVAGGSDNQISSSRSDSMKFSLNDSHASGVKIGITLNNFGQYTGNDAVLGAVTYTERAQFDFYNGNHLVGTVTKASCAKTQTTVSYTITPVPQTTFDAVVVTPIAPSSDPAGSSGDTSFSISGINFCSAGGSCATGISPAMSCL